MRFLALLFSLFFTLNLFAEETIERRFAKWSEAYKSTTTVTVGDKKEELTFYLLIEATDNLPFTYKNKRKTSTSGYTFYLTVEKGSDETKKREILLSAAHTEKILKEKDGVKTYTFIQQGEKVEIKISEEEKRLKASKLSVNTEDEAEVEDTVVPVYSDIDLKLEKATLEEVLK